MSIPAAALMHNFSTKAETEFARRYISSLRLRGPIGRYFRQLIVATIATCAVSAAPLHAADIRGEIIGGGKPGPGGVMLGPRLWPKELDG
jgi:hypothetical protein